MNFQYELLHPINVNGRTVIETGAILDDLILGKTIIKELLRGRELICLKRPSRKIGSGEYQARHGTVLNGTVVLQPGGKYDTRRIGVLYRQIMAHKRFIRVLPRIEKIPEKKPKKQPPEDKELKPIAVATLKIDK